jgi:hypothetical protein
MLTWLSARPNRRAARPAKPVVGAPKKRPTPPQVEEDLPPPFFADEDTAFLDMGDERLTPPPLPPVAASTPRASEPNSFQARLSQALLALPPYPERGDANRMRQLLDIFRTLDRIAGAACEPIESSHTSR